MSYIKDIFKSLLKGNSAKQVQAEDIDVDLSASDQESDNYKKGDETSGMNNSVGKEEHDASSHPGDSTLTLVENNNNQALNSKISDFENALATAETTLKNHITQYKRLKTYKANSANKEFQDLVKENITLKNRIKLAEKDIEDLEKRIRSERKSHNKSYDSLYEKNKETEKDLRALKAKYTEISYLLHSLKHDHSWLITKHEIMTQQFNKISMMDTVGYETLMVANEQLTDELATAKAERGLMKSVINDLKMNHDKEMSKIKQKHRDKLKIKNETIRNLKKELAFAAKRIKFLEENVQSPVSWSEDPA